jgi:DNA binding domain of tn916 integrase.
MSEKRKDNQGRVLKDGESQRSDGSYQYRYTDIKGKRRYVYAPTLAKLREKRKESRRQFLMTAWITVPERSLSRSLSRNTCARSRECGTTPGSTTILFSVS